MKNSNDGTIGYILKGYPRTSETFITNEIYLLEQLGLKLHIFSAKTLTGQKRHGVVSRIKAAVTYLPEATELSDRLFVVWLWINLPRFIGSHLKLAGARPIAYVRGLLAVVWLSFKYRSRFWSWPRKVFFKEFLQAGYIAQQALADGQIRHFHAHFCHGSTTIAMFASRLSGIPFSFTAHAKDIYLRELNPGDLLRLKMRRARFMVTCTRTNREHLDRVGARELSIHTIYHGLDTTLFAPSASAHAEAGPPLILSVGRIVEKKGFAYLVEACRLLKERGYEFQCQIVGGADGYSPTLAQLISAAGLETTILVQHAVTQEALQAIYQRCTIFALPCQILENGDRDGIPNVLVEAMAMELPVVSTNISGIPELVEDHRNGLLVPQRDAAALADAFEELLQDAALRQRLGKAARVTVCRQFDSRENTRALLALFDACLATTEERHRAVYASH